MIKKFTTILFAFVLSFLVHPTVYGANEFSTSYNVSYEVAEDGNTQITQKINLKNLTSQYYVSNFTLSIGSTTITDVLATDSVGPMETKVESSDGKTSINVKFNQQIAGVDKVQVFTLKFKSKDFAQALGKTWEVNLPKLPNAANIESYNLTLSVPVSFGDPTSITPRPVSKSQTFARLFFTYDKESLSKSGVSLNFGANQIFDFTMKYFLDNNSLVPVYTSITLPPDTNYQDVLISRIIPEPSNVTIDEDGNYLAWYKLERGQKQQIMVYGSAKLYITPKASVLGISQPYRDQLLKPDVYWETEHPTIKSVLKEIFKDNGVSGQLDLPASEKARLIYQYVVGILKYDAGRLDNTNIDRLGAVTILGNPNAAVCMEFTDLFITLARAAGVPARELDGFAYSKNPNLRPLSLSRNLLHAWPEYYDENKGWIMVDPTWENTSGGVDYFNKFDLNHLVLAVKGVSSRSPYISDDIKVDISGQDFLVKQKSEVVVDQPKYLWSGFPFNVTVRVLNRGQSTIEPNVLTLIGDNKLTISPTMINTSAIPPFGYQSFKAMVKSDNLLQAVEIPFDVDFGGGKSANVLKIKPFFASELFSYIIAVSFIFFSGLYLAVFLVHYTGKRISNK